MILEMIDFRVILKKFNTIKKKNVKLNMNLINLFSFYVYYKLNSKQNINNQLMI